MTRRGTRLETIIGQVPPLARMPSGCRFAARCPQAVAICHETRPRGLIWGGQRVRCHLQPAPHFPLPRQGRGVGGEGQRRFSKHDAFQSVAVFLSPTPPANGRGESTPKEGGKKHCLGG